MKTCLSILCGLLAGGLAAWGDLEHARPIGPTTVHVGPLVHVERMAGVAVVYSPVGGTDVTPGAVALRLAPLDAAGAALVMTEGLPSYRVAEETDKVDGWVSGLGMMAVGRAQVGPDVGLGFDALGAILSLKDAVVGIGSLAAATGDSLVAGRVTSHERVMMANTELDMAAPLFVSARSEETRLGMVAPTIGEAVSVDTALVMTAPLFRTITETESLDTDLLMLPCRIWRGSPAGVLREAARGAAASGDMEAAEQYTAAYWRVVNQVFARRRVFEQRPDMRRKEPFRE